MDKNKSLHFKTTVVHSGFEGDITGAVMPPIYLSTTYKQKEPGKPIGEFEYSRSSNPNRSYLEKALATVEHGKYGMCFASGCAALATLLQGLSQGAHVIVGDDVYGGTVRLFANVYAEKGVAFTQVDCCDLEKFKEAIRPNTELIWIETPSNPMLKIIDIKQISQIKAQVAPNAYLFVDNTFATPYLQTPLQLGADGVCHSTTKYIGGHSDVVGGALIVNDEKLAENIAYYQNAVGAIPAPLDCYLLHRSLKTLAVRMDAHCNNAERIVEYFQSHNRVKKIHYPGLETHPNHQVARNQMKRFGGMISVVFDLNMTQIKTFLNNLSLFTLAESLGGVESLVEHPAIMTHATIAPAHRKQLGIEDGLLRFSVGIEAVEDLIEDIDQALSKTL